MPGREDEAPSLVFDKAELRERLTSTQYQVTQEHHTERQYTNKYYKHYEPGTYRCIVCGVDQFTSQTKYDSGSGWPSFWDVVDKTNIRCRPDASAVGGNLLRIISNPSLIRTEVSCKICGSHLGHVFKDGPKPTGLRYCVNSASLDFIPDMQTSTDSVDAPAIISHPATLGGCGGVDGVCQRPPKSSKSPPKITSSAELRSSPSASNLRSEKASSPASTATTSGVGADEAKGPAAPLFHPATLGGCGGVDGVCTRLDRIKISSRASTPS